MAELPGPSSLPVIGNLHQLKKPPCLTFARFGNIYGDVFQLKLGSTTTVILNSTEALRQGFDKQGEAFSYRSEHFTSFKLYKEVRGVENTGLTVRSASTDIWRVQHAVMGRAIKHIVLQSEGNRFEKCILSETCKLIHTWLGEDKGGSCVIDPVSSFRQIISTTRAAYMVGDYVCNDIEEFDKRLEAYTNASVKMLALMRSGFLNDFLPYLAFLTKSKQNQLREVLSVGAQFFDDIYKAHQISYQEGSTETIMDCIATFQDEMEKKDPDRQRLPRKTIFGIIPELFEGVVNVSDALIKIIMYMVHFPEVQEQVREELRNVFGTSCYPSLKNRQRLPFTEAVMYEVWRHSSFITGTVPHTCIKDVVLGGSYNYVIPKGATVIGNLFSINKDPKVWNKPEEFNPKRFIKELEQGPCLDEEKVKDCMMFSIGKRSCIAELIVKRELLLVYGTLLHLCKFENEGSVLTMQEVGGLAVPQNGSLKIKITRTDVDVNTSEN